MRVLVYQALTEDTGLMDLLPGGISGDRADGVPDLRPFGVLTWEGPNPGIGRAMQMRMTLHVHDNPGDFTRIDEILRYVRDLMESATPRKHQGVTLSHAEWIGMSPDLHDEDRRTNLKTVTFLLTGSGL